MNVLLFILFIFGGGILLFLIIVFIAKGGMDAYNYDDGEDDEDEYTLKDDLIEIIDRIKDFVLTDNGELVSNIDNAMDIVAEWQEEINEEELDKLAWDLALPKYIDEFGTHTYNWVNGFRAGFRKAIDRIFS